MTSQEFSMKWSVSPLFAAVVAATVCHAADFAWLEGEKPTSKNYACAAAGVERSQLLSGGLWLAADLDPDKVQKQCPKEGILLGYDFVAPSAGNYEIWNRIGMEGNRSAFEWRVDGGKWQTIRPQDLTCDMMDVGFWNEVAWIQMGSQDLTAGRHVLQIRLAKTAGKILYCSDALCIFKGHFRPNGKFPPDADWQTVADKQAAAQVFKFDAATTAAAERIELPLGGLWQACRFDEQEVVGPCRTDQDAARCGRGLLDVDPRAGQQVRRAARIAIQPPLRLPHARGRARRAGRPLVRPAVPPSQSLIASVHVNGQFCGWTKAPFAAWECDITRAVRPGQVNEICLVIKDSYYAISEKKAGKSCRLMFNTPVAWVGSQNWINQFFDFPIGTGDYGGKSGILATPSLIVAGEVYAADVFVKPSVRKKQLGIELTLTNSSGQDRNVQICNEVQCSRPEQACAVPAITSSAAKSLARKNVPQSTAAIPGPAGTARLSGLRLSTRAVTIPGRRREVVELAEPWENPRLWWPDDPALYDAGDHDQGRWPSGRRAPHDLRLPRVGVERTAIQTQRRALAALGRLHGERRRQRPRGGDRHSGAPRPEHLAILGQQFGGLDRQKALDLMDARGIIVRRSGIFDGEGANYLHQLANGRELFDNWIDQLKAWVKEERNHPSILIWSIENEITFINSRNLGLHETVEPQIARAAREVMALDPTRPAMADGGNCLVSESLPVNGVHYQESFWRDYPDEAYTLAKAVRGPREAGHPLGKGALAARARPAHLHGRIVFRPRQQSGRLQPVCRRRLLHGLGAGHAARRRTVGQDAGRRLPLARRRRPTTSGSAPKTPRCTTTRGSLSACSAASGTGPSAAAARSRGPSKSATTPAPATPSIWPGSCGWATRPWPARREPSSSARDSMKKSKSRGRACRWRSGRPGSSFSPAAAAARMSSAK